MKRLDTLDGRIAFFFDSPKKHPTKHRTPEGYESVLYLLRRDIQHCFFNCNGRIVDESEVEAKVKEHWHRLFPGILVIMSGIDLLAKFLEGDDCRKWGKVGERFTKYLESYFDGLPEDQAKLIYKVRNCLVHSFGLYDKDMDKNIVIAPRSPEGKIVTTTDKWCILHYKDLCVQFLRSVKKYRADLQERPKLQERFDKMFAHYGYLVHAKELN